MLGTMKSIPMPPNHVRIAARIPQGGLLGLASIVELMPGLAKGAASELADAASNAVSGVVLTWSFTPGGSVRLVFFRGFCRRTFALILLELSVDRLAANIQKARCLGLIA